MTRLIYADELMKYAHDVTLANGARHRCVDATVIYAIPTVDAVPIKWLYEQSDNPDRSDRFRNACDLVALTWLEERKEE